MIDMTQCAAWVYHKCCRHAHDSPSAGEFGLLGCVNFNDMQGAAEQLTQFLYGWALNCFAGNAGGGGEVGQGKKRRGESARGQRAGRGCEAEASNCRKDKCRSR